MQNKDIEKILTDVKLYLIENGSNTTIFDEIYSAQENSQTLLDHNAIQRAKDWNELANKIVGRHEGAY